MANNDYKMRERWEQKEYFGDSHGETRLEKSENKRLKKIKTKALKEHRDDL